MRRVPNQLTSNELQLATGAAKHVAESLLISCKLWQTQANQALLVKDCAPNMPILKGMRADFWEVKSGVFMRTIAQNASF